MSERKEGAGIVRGRETPTHRVQGRRENWRSPNHKRKFYETRKEYLTKIVLKVL